MSIARHFTTLLSGRLLSQLLLILSTPLLTRCFSPEDFGVISLIGSLTQIPAMLLMGRLDQALPQSRSHEEAGQILSLCVVFGCVILLSCLGLAWLSGPWLAERYQQPQLPLLLFMTTLLFIPQSVTQLGKQWSSYRERHGITASADVLTTLMRRGAPIPLSYWMGSTPWALLIGQSLGLVGSASLFITQLSAEVRSHLDFTASSLKATWQNYRHFTLYLSGSSLFDLFAWSLLPLIIGDFYGLTAVGWFGQAHALLLLPTSLLNQSATHVFYPRLAQSREDPASLQNLLKRMSLLSIDLALYPLIILIPLAPELWSLVLSDAFAMSGELAQVLIPMVIMNVIVSPLSVLVNVLHLHRPFFWQSVVLNIVRTSALICGCIWGNLTWALGAYSLSTATIKAYQFCWLLNRGGVSLTEVCDGLIVKLGYCVTLASLLFMLHAEGVSLLILFTLMMSGALGWTAIIIKLNPDARALSLKLSQRFFTQKS